MQKIIKYQKNAEDFWNDFNNIKWFKDEPAPQYWIDFLKKDSNKNKIALDLGCGAGRNTEVLFKLGFNTYASDLYQNMVLTTRERLQNIGINKDVVNTRVNQGDMLNINFPDDFFDLVISNGVFHNAYDLLELNRAIAEVSRVLKTGGHLCFNLFSSECTDSFKKIGNSIYVTKEELVMTLITSKEFENICSLNKLKLKSPIVEYKREVTTGMRAIMRGIMIKG